VPAWHPHVVKVERLTGTRKEWPRGWKRVSRNYGVILEDDGADPTGSACATRMTNEKGPFAEPLGIHAGRRTPTGCRTLSINEFGDIPNTFSGMLR